jgi:hypothetical protein
MLLWFINEMLLKYRIQRYVTRIINEKLLSMNQWNVARNYQWYVTKLANQWYVTRIFNDMLLSMRINDILLSMRINEKWLGLSMKSC